MKKAAALLIFAALLICCALSGCGNNAESADGGSDKLSIVTTIFPYYDFTRNIVGDSAEIKLLLSPGSEPHSYDPTPSDIIAIESCDIFIYNGGESDGWAESVLSSLQNEDIIILKMTDFADLLYEMNPDHTEGDGYDEHIWTSIRNAEKLTAAIAEAVSERDGGNAEKYSENADAYIERLDALDREFAEAVESAERDTLVFGDRFPFLYFVTDYGLNYECAFPGCSSETEPSLEVVTRLVDYVRDSDVSVVFYLELSNGRIAELIAEDSGAATMRFNSCHNLSKTDFENGESYISLMEQNLRALKEALS